MPGYTDLPEGWVWDVVHWFMVITFLSPFILAICLILLNVLFPKSRKGLSRYD